VFCHTGSFGSTSFIKILQRSFLGTEFPCLTEANSSVFCLFSLLWSSFRTSQDSGFVFFSGRKA